MENRKRTIRTSVTIPSEDHTELQTMAERRKVTVAWLIREAVASYLAAKTPLLPREPRQ